MNGKLAGLMACVVLILSAILATWFTVDRNFPHQHLLGDPLDDPDLVSADIGEKVLLDKSDYHLNEYLFRNLAGELLLCAPVTFYTQENGELFLFRQSQEDCVRSECKYAIQISPKDAAGSYGTEQNDSDRIITFADYNYLDTSERKSVIVIDGFREKEDIRLDISRFEKSLYSYDYDSWLYGYKEKINILCFINYFLLYELAYPGNCRENTALLYYDSNGRYSICTGDFPGSGYYGGKTDYHNLISSVWFTMLLKSPAFTENMIDEYRYHREHLFSEAYLVSYLEELSAFLSQSELIDKESLNRQKEALCGYLHDRLQWLDNNIGSLREFSALSAVKEYRNTPY